MRLLFVVLACWAMLIQAVFASNISSVEERLQSIREHIEQLDQQDTAPTPESPEQQPGRGEDELNVQHLHEEAAELLMHLKRLQVRPKAGIIPERPEFEGMKLWFSERVEKFLPDKPYLTVDEVAAAEAEILRFNIPRPVVASVSASWIPLEFKHWKNYCPDNCELLWSQDKSTDVAADIIWRGEPQPPTHHFPEQVIVGNCGEAYTGTGRNYYSKLRSYMDFSGGYIHEDRFWTSWFALEWAPPSWDVGNVTAAVRLMMSSEPSVEERLSIGATMFHAHNNCGGERGQLFAMLQPLKTVAHGVGHCGRNHHLPAEWGRSQLLFWPNNEGFEFVQKAWLARKYLVGAAMENTQVADYFTEKRFQILLGGAIPVVWGNDNSLDYLPHPDAAIIADPNNLPALVDYLKLLASPEGKDSIAKHLRWKKRGIISREFVKILFHGFTFVGCRLCELMTQVNEFRSEQRQQADQEEQPTQSSVTEEKPFFD